MHKKIIEHFRKHDPILWEVSNKVGILNAPITSDYFITLVESIVSQQLSVKAADTIFNRLKQLFPNETITPEEVLELSDETLRTTGLSRSKITYLKDLASKVTKGELVFETLLQLEDEAVIQELIKVKGIGRWTAEMFLMFSLNRPNVFSPQDVGLQNAIKKLYKLEILTKDDLEKISGKWAPYRTYACRLLWASLKLK